MLCLCKDSARREQRCKFTCKLCQAEAYLMQRYNIFPTSNYFILCTCAVKIHDKHKMKEVFLVFLGGGAGSVCRYLISLFIGKHVPQGFPWPTLSVNLLGCLAIGLFYAWSERWAISPEYRLLLTVGLCGGFTTFSTFSNEALQLLKGNMHGLFACYVFASIILGLAGVFAGLWAGQKYL